MANEEHLKILKEGVETWNKWRAEDWDIVPDLNEAFLGGMDLSKAYLGGAELNRADLRDANLSKADLSGAELNEAYLSGANLSKANLRAANLGGAYLYRANLSAADLREADLSEANLSESNLRSANLRGAILNGTDLSQAVLIKANLSKAKANLKEANLSLADLRQAILKEADLPWANLASANLNTADLKAADLSGAYLGEANLSGANLADANLTEANLRGTILTGANLSRANLSGGFLLAADLRNASLIETDLSGASLVLTDLASADITHCRVYGISAWDLNLEGINQLNLIITPADQPTITVDNLEVAQFIYLLLNNEKIRDVIDTVAKKAVLILGRFTPDRKAILDAIRERLRQHDYLPIMFDFDKPASRDLTETVSTLAHMSRFIIADITEPRSIPQELQAIIPVLAIPVQPLLLKGSTGEYAMFQDLRKYPWVLTTYEYSDTGELLSSLDDKVIAPAEAKVIELRG